MTTLALNLVVIRAADIDQLASFYEQLGLQFTKHRHGKGPEHYSCELGSVVFEIYPQRSDTNHTKDTRLGFQVDSVDETVAKLRERSTQIISPTKDSPWGRRAVIVDPEGHRVELTELL